MPAIAASGNGVVTASYDVNVDALIDAPVRTTNLPEFLAAPGLSAVYIATPNHTHRALVEACARANVAVLCEKPMATSLADARAMVAACRDAGVLYATAFDQRFHPAHRVMARMIANGSIGAVTAVRIVYACWVAAEFAADNWRIDPVRAGGGAMIDLAPHGLDLSSMLVGEPLIEVAALGQGRIHLYARDGVDDGAMLIARTASGVLISLHVAYNYAETLPRRRLEVIGIAGQLVAEDTMGQSAGGTLVRMDAMTQAVEPVVFGADGPFTCQVRSFAEAVLGHTAFEFTPEHDLHTMEMLMRAQAMLAA